MTDWKKHRERVGYTFSKMSKDVGAWHRSALGYRAAAETLNECHEQIPGDTRPFAFNAALSLELVLKTILVQRDVDFPNSKGGHDLIALAKKASISFTNNQQRTLEMLTVTICWSGRYPVPNTEREWNEYHDVTSKPHIIRTTVGNVSSTFANRDTFPNWENYLKIWKVCSSEFQKSSLVA